MNYIEKCLHDCQNYPSICLSMLYTTIVEVRGKNAYQLERKKTEVVGYERGNDSKASQMQKGEETKKGRAVEKQGACEKSTL